MTLSPILGRALLASALAAGTIGAFTAMPASAAAPAAQSCKAVQGKADASADCTPGAFNPDVTQDTISKTICVPGWTKTVRPPASYTTDLKNKQKPIYGESNISNADLEEDHLVPLELGGAPRDPHNLWPEPRADVSTGGQAAEDKDKVENDLKTKVCAGSLTLAAARQQILDGWTHK